MISPGLFDHQIEQTTFRDLDDGTRELEAESLCKRRF